MKYCKRCIIPDTRPNIEYDNEGICNACRAHETKRAIDWPKRESLFKAVVSKAKSKSDGYDCLIPVSGGKDSTWQVVKCLEYGLRPLCVTWKTPVRTPIGIANLDNLIELGVDHMDYQVNPHAEKKFMIKALEEHGSAAIPMHLAIYNIPRYLAVKLNIPLIIWGENGAFEYGCSDEEREGFVMDRAWLNKHGVSHDMDMHDFVSEELSEKDLLAYRGATDEELIEKKVLSIFLGYYFEWDPENTFKVAKEHGFKVSDEGPRTGYYNYADLDDYFISIHHFIKWYKFGFTRAFDNLSIEIRNGRMTREQAIQIVKESGNQTPHRDIEKFCKFLGMSETRFYEIVEKFRNQKIWKKRDGVWILDDFLIPDWDWKASEESIPANRG